MLPLSSPNQLRDRRLSDAVSLAYFALGRAIRLLPNKQYLTGLCFGNLAVHMGLSAWAPVSSLRYAIKDIIQILPKPKMRRVAAWRIVASVEYIKPLWNGAPSKRPSQSVSLPSLFAIPRRTISASYLGLLPNPARIGAARLVHLGPKLFYGRNLNVRVAVVAKSAIMFIAQTLRLVHLIAADDFANSHGYECTMIGNKAQL